MREDVQPNDERAVETALLADMAAGRHDALAALYLRRGTALHSFLLRMLGSAEEAEELLQDAFVHFWNHARAYDPTKASPFTWMVMITRGLAVTRLRSRSRRNHHLSAYEQEVASLEVDHLSRQTPASDRELADRMSQALHGLSDPQREAIELAFYRGWSHEEISRASGQPLGTVKSHIRRGMLALRQRLKDFYA